MHIIVDLDNTIICYEKALAVLAKQMGIMVPNSANKETIKSSLLSRPDGLTLWTLVQGVVYGPSMKKAVAYRGVRSFFSSCHRAGVCLSVVSHRTKYPILGEKIDLHDTAMTWLRDHHFFSAQQLTPAQVFFEETQEKKVARIRRMGATHIIDDLLAILMHPLLPGNLKKIWFGCPDQTLCPTDTVCCPTWQSIKRYFPFDQV